MIDRSFVAFAQPRKALGSRAEARNAEIQRCLRMGADYIFMMDSDQTMPFTGWTKLTQRLTVNEADIAVIDTPPHGSEQINCIYNPDGTIASCSIACALIKADVFQKLPYPWFDSHYDYQPAGQKDGKLLFDKHLKYQDNGVGEDIFFVRNAIEAGLKIEYITSIRCNHYELGEI